MSQLTITSSITATLAGLVLAASANANLIVNGGFEEAPTGSPIGGGSGWNYYDADDINGWDGDNLELWIGRNPDAYEGDYHAELNAHGQNGENWVISQTFDTVIGQTYDLFFAYSARRGDADSSSEVFEVEVNGTIAGTTDDFSYTIEDHTKNTWIEFSESFVATSTSSTLSFASIVPYSATVGNFLDAVSVTADTTPTGQSIPEPGSLALLALGLAGLRLSRKKAK
ncbi:PEP-CTERM sorting domain-containing protein [Oceanicoccus sagamiensis]|uniref:PEP-CTERM protein-sorting domain-containing protein n=1 Tax=Oceanicoccus sagamiensis TaxID=716816 RepID=A0A1X9NQG0_9GAMM|nr:PEP-CTERM sorting domain-containing protein [Oceanicoccus sagamiensis]ARN76063.1 hypothetical protein BST96_19355 [Oceanicoccus sagamiensis]